MPVPETLTVKGAKLEVIWMVPLCAPATAGVNVALIVHVEFAPTDPLHVSVSANPPLAVMLTGCAIVPRFVTVKVFAALV